MACVCVRKLVIVGCWCVLSGWTYEHNKFENEPIRAWTGKKRKTETEKNGTQIKYIIVISENMGTNFSIR